MRPTSEEGAGKGKGKGVAASPQEGAAKAPIGGPPATNSVPIQVGDSGQASGAQSGFQSHEGNGFIEQLAQQGGGDGQFGQSQYHTQDFQDPGCSEYYSPGERYPSPSSH